MAALPVPLTLNHVVWGECVLERIEDSDWLLRVNRRGALWRFPTSIHHEFEIRIEENVENPVDYFVAAKTSTAEIEAQGANGSTAVAFAIESETATATATATRTTRLAEDRAKRHKALRLFEALRGGLLPRDVSARELAVEGDLIHRAIEDLLIDVNEEGGRAMVFRGAYGQGKTFTLKLLEETALSQGYATARVEIDSAENCLSRPWQVVRELLSNLRLPDDEAIGSRALAERALESVRCTSDLDPTAKRKIAQESFDQLKEELECPPLAWILADPDLLDKPELLGLLACDPVADVAIARKAHILKTGAEIWPAFNAGTQGDFASFLLSGLGRLSRRLDFKGFIVILDEMERWQDLNWTEQCHAGNWLGGLIWGAVAEQGRRDAAHEPKHLTHGGRGGGFPFTTPGRCHLGVAIAMTPRGENGPELDWSRYGLLEIVDLPTPSKRHLVEYARKIAPIFAAVHGLETPLGPDFDRIVRESLTAWNRSGAFSIRAVVQSVVAALDSWREDQAN